MGFILSREGFNEIITQLSSKYRIYAPVLKKGEGRFTDTDVVMYDFVSDPGEIEIDRKSDYSFKNVLVPFSQTLFYFAEEAVKEADFPDKDILVFLRACDLHALRRQDAIYLENGAEEDWFYRRVRDRLHFVLIGCPASFEDCFCVSMGTNRVADGYMFSVETAQDGIACDLHDEELAPLFTDQAEAVRTVVPSYAKENDTKVDVPDQVPLSIYKDPLWDEYNSRCIGCGRCTLVCPTCTCYTMEDIYYTDNGRAGERRRVQASCMIDGYSNVAGGGQYRKTKGERMRFKVLHKISDFKAKFGCNMCVGCGRCDMVCPEYISFSNCINKTAAAVRAQAEGKEGEQA